MSSALSVTMIYIYICGKRSELMLAPAPHGCCILHMVRRVLCTSASANSACCIQSCTLFAFRKYGRCVRTPCPHIIHHLSAPHPHMDLHMIHFPQLPPYISLLILTLFIVFHHLFCLFNTPSHIKHCSTYSVTYNESDHTNSSEPVEGSQGSQS